MRGFLFKDLESLSWFERAYSLAVAIPAAKLPESCWIRLKGQFSD